MAGVIASHGYAGLVLATLMALIIASSQVGEFLGLSTRAPDPRPVPGFREALEQLPTDKA